MNKISILLAYHADALAIRASAKCSPSYHSFADPAFLLSHTSEGEPCIFRSDRTLHHTTRSLEQACVPSYPTGRNSAHKIICIVTDWRHVC